MKFSIACLLSLCGFCRLAAQPSNVGIGTVTPVASAKLEISSTSQGILIPRMTAQQRTAIAAPAIGLQVYQLDGNPGLYHFNGRNWQSSTTGGMVDSNGLPPDYGTIAPLAGSLTRANGSIDGNGTAARFYSPQAVTIDPSGNIYVPDFTISGIRKITPDGTVTTLAGGSGSNGIADGTGTAAQFQNPTGLAVDGAGNVFVADYGNHKIRKVTPAGVVTTIAGGGTTGKAWGYKDTLAAYAMFNYPTGIILAPDGTLIVSEAGNQRIRKISPAGQVTTFAGSGTADSVEGAGTAASFNIPIGLALDGSGNLYVADQANHRIRKITPSGMVSTLAGSGLPGHVDDTGRAARFRAPRGVTVGSDGSIYVTERTNYIRRILPDGRVVTVAGLDNGSGSGLTGNTDGPRTVATFNDPGGIAIDPRTGIGYIADGGNNRVRKIFLR